MIREMSTVNVAASTAALDGMAMVAAGAAAVRAARGTCAVEMKTSMRRDTNAATSGIATEGASATAAATMSVTTGGGTAITASTVAAANAIVVAVSTSSAVEMLAGGAVTAAVDTTEEGAAVETAS